MNHRVACIVLSVVLVPALAFGQVKTKSQTMKRGSSQSSAVQRDVSSETATNGGSKSRLLKICQGVPIPSGYVIVAYETSTACLHGAYVLQKDESRSQFAEKTDANKTGPNAVAATVKRPRRVSNTTTDSVVLKSKDELNGPPVMEPVLSGTPLETKLNPTAKDASSSNNTDEIGPGDVVRIDTNLVTVPVSVLDRQGRFVPNLQRQDFKVMENGVEQRIAYFEPTEKPFTVALLLDTSGSTVFHLSEIKDAAIAFAKQLRPQDRVLVVTFNEQVLLLTEATNDVDVVTEVITQFANTGYSTRLYDAIDLVIKERLDQIKGRKAIVLFTDGVDTASYQASYESTLRQAEELDALIYPVQYDTTDFIAATQGSIPNVTIVTSTSGSWPFPGRSSSRVIYGSRVPTVRTPGTSMSEYQLADRYLHQLADKSGARLFKANDSTQLAQAFSKIAEELRCQYSLGYYPQVTLEEGERRLIKVRVDQPDLAVRARDSYIQRVSSKTSQ